MRIRLLSWKTAGSFLWNGVLQDHFGLSDAVGSHRGEGERTSERWSRGIAGAYELIRPPR